MERKAPMDTGKARGNQGDEDTALSNAHASMHAHGGTSRQHINGHNGHDGTYRQRGCDVEVLVVNVRCRCEPLNQQREKAGQQTVERHGVDEGGVAAAATKV